MSHPHGAPAGPNLPPPAAVAHGNVPPAPGIAPLPPQQGGANLAPPPGAMPPQPHHNQHPAHQHADPANLLELRASLPNQGENIMGSRLYGDQRYRGAVEGYARTLGEVRRTERAGADIDEAQNQALLAARETLNGQVAHRAIRNLPQRIAERVADLGRPLTDDENDAVIEQCLMEELSLSVIATAVAQEEMAPAELQPRGGRIRNAVGRVMGSRVTRGIILGAATIGIGVGILSGAFAPMAIAAGVGGVTSMGLRRFARHRQGVNDARARNEMRNTRREVGGSNNEMLRGIEMPDAANGDTYHSYMNVVTGALHGQAERQRHQNRTERHELPRNARQVGAGRTVRDFIYGAYVGAGFAGALHVDPNAVGAAMHGDFSHVTAPFHGGEASGAAAAPQLPPDIQNQLAAAANTGDYSQLQALLGNKYHIMSLDDLTRQLGAHHTYAGENMADIMAQQGVQGSSMDLLNRGIEAVNNSGLGINAEWAGNYYQVSVTDPNLFIVTPDNAVVPIAQATVQGGNQSALAFAAANGWPIVDGSRIAEIIQANIATQTTQQVHAAAAGLGINLPADIAAGLAGGVIAASTGPYAPWRNANAPVAGAAAAATANRQGRNQEIRDYLDEPDHQGFAQDLPRNDQMAYVRMVHGMTNMSRAEIATALGLPNNVIADLAAED